jgi:DNA polymerase-3 subunit alpha
LDLIWKQIGFDYHPYNIPLTDRMTFDFFKNGDMTNVFQFNTPLMKSILSRFMPNSMSDLSLLNAMYRPGPMENIPSLIHNKQIGYENSYTSDLRVQNILHESYGMLVYQETLMHLLNEIAGISYINADIYRRQLIFSRKEAEIFQFKREFEKGCKTYSNLNSEDIENLSKLILEHPRFLFQKSHTLCYSTIAYWCAFYKMHFEKEFERAFNS